MVASVREQVSPARNKLEKKDPFFGLRVATHMRPMNSVHLYRAGWLARAG